MTINKLAEIKNKALSLKQVMESNYVPLLKNNLVYVTKIYNYLSNVLSDNVKLDSQKAEVFYNKSIKDFYEIEYNLKRLGLHRAA